MKMKKIQAIKTEIVPDQVIVQDLCDQYCVRRNGHSIWRCQHVKSFWNKLSMTFTTLNLQLQL